MKDIVFQICESMLRNSPARSYKRLNPALRGTLANCISADLPFQPDTFRRIYNELRGSWWFGDGAGSHTGEHFYTLACGCNHASAQQSFEKFAERPAFLWEEDARQPERLCVGSLFTWRGYFVTATSLRKDSLTACTYKSHRSGREGIQVGATICYNPKYVITSAKKDGKATVLRVVKAPESRGETNIGRRFIITYDELTKVRRESKARLKAMLKKIAECDPDKDADKLTKEINAAHFRHWELEDIRAAYSARMKWGANQQTVEAWRKGVNGAFLDVETIHLRVNGDSVECSNGNRISTATAKAVLPILLDQRNKNVALDLPVDGYRVTRLSQAGVQVGCTLVPWPEIDRLIPELK